MAEGADFTEYPLKFCPRREIQKEFLKAHHIGNEAAGMPSAITPAELLVGFFVMAYFLRKGKIFLMSKELFKVDRVNEERIFHLC